MKTKKRLLGILLSLALMLGLMPGMSLTAYADDPYASIKNTTTVITFDGKSWYLTDYDDTTVTLLSKECVAASKYDSNESSNTYSGSTVESTVNTWYTQYITADAKAAVVDNKMFLLTTDQANTIQQANSEVLKCNQASGAGSNAWWLCSPGSTNNRALSVYGDTGSVNGFKVGNTLGVRPALKLNLSSVIFSSESKTFTVGSTSSYSVTVTAGSNMTKTAASGAASQTGLSGAMTDVVYTADEGYYFPENYSVEAVNGISVTRNSYTQITVSGTPTADAAIALTAPTAKTTPDAPTTATATDCTTADNNDGTLTGVTTAMEYKKSDAADWTAGTGSDITGLVSGTYYVRVKATDTTNASGNQTLTIKGFISYTVTYKVVNGKWNDETTADKTATLTGHYGDTLNLTAEQIPAVGDKPNDTYKAGSWDVTPSADTEITGATTYTYTYAQKDSISQTVTFKVVNGSWNDETTTDKTVTLTGYEGDTLKLAANQIPEVGTKPNDTYKAGSWDVMPNTNTAITEATTYTYTYVAKEASVVTKAPEAKTLTYNGQAQELVTAGTATGGEMQYALGTATEATGSYTTDIPSKTDAGTYYVWYKAVGDGSHTDSDPGVVSVKIKEGSESHKHDIKKMDAKEPTCTEDGYKAHYECTECGKWFEDANGSVEITDKSSFIKKAIGHKWDKGVITKEATYDETGIKTFTCENDPSHTKEEEIPRKVYYERESDTDNSDGSSGSSGGGSGKNSGSVSKQSIDVNGNTISSNHQAETGVPASDVGGRWANSANADIWTYTKSDGTLAKSEWMSLDYNGLRYWYYFNEDGIMLTNWFDYNGERFYLMPESDGWRGRMATGWKNIDNKWYYFDIVPGSTQGKLYRGAITPDGHVVGADGAWNGVGETPVGQE